jgi:transposase
LLKAREAIEQQIDDRDGKVLKLARHDAQVRRFMTVPGVGPITALCFKRRSTIQRVSSDREVSVLILD